MRWLVYHSALPVWLLLTLLASSSLRAEEGPLVLSSLPFERAAETEKVYSQLADYLGSAVGRPAFFDLGPRYEGVVAGLESGKIHVAFVGATVYEALRAKGKVRAVAVAVRGGKTQYQGVIVVPSTSAAASLTDLKGKKIAFVDRHSTAGYVAPRALLTAAGLDVDKDLESIFAGNHESAARLVAMGKADAAACFAGAEEGLGLRVLAKTAPIPGDLVVLSTALGDKLTKKITAALLGAGKSQAAAAFLKTARIDGFVAAE